MASKREPLGQPEKQVGAALDRARRKKMNAINSGIALEVCSNLEWLREFAGYDIADNDQAAEFKSEIFSRLANLGYEVDWAKGQRTLCHGWNGANTFRHKLGPVGCFQALTTEQESEIQAAIDAAAEAAK